MYIEGEREAKIQALFVFVMPHTLTHISTVRIYITGPPEAAVKTIITVNMASPCEFPGADEARGYVPGNQRKGSALRYSELRLNV